MGFRDDLNGGAEEVAHSSNEEGVAHILGGIGGFVEKDAGAAIDGIDGVGGGGVLDDVSHVHGHRHELSDRLASPPHSPVKILIIAAVVLHLIGLAVWIRAWWRQRKLRDPTMRGVSPAPPARVNCSYDMDGNMKRSISIPRNIELALKGLDLHGLAGLKPSQA